MTDQTPPAPPAPPAPEVEQVDETPKRFAAYDNTLLKYVGGVHDTEAGAKAAAKDRGVKRYEIREV